MFSFLAAFLLALAPLALAEQRGVVAGAAAAELRKEKSETAPVVESVTAGEAFSFKVDEGNEWVEVTTAAGKSGWLPLSQVRLFFGTGDLPKKDRTGLSEIDDAARRRGLDYSKVTRLASQGDAKALKQFFALARAADGAAAESLTSIPTMVYHLLGDEKFAKFLRAQSESEQGMMRNIVVGDGQLPPTTQYLQRHFPETTKVLFPSEMVAWPSPDGRYAIRKVFSDPFDLFTGKITRAELIEKQSGRVVLDMTADDIGIGPKREGKILWAPDSKRFASVSSDLGPRQGNLFSEPRLIPTMTKTVVYQVTGESWSRVEMAFEPVPGRDADKEMEGARLGHDYIEAERWVKPNVLRLSRHEYYEKLQPTTLGKSTFQSIVGFARWYAITATISPEGKATLVWKLRTD